MPTYESKQEVKGIYHYLLPAGKKLCKSYFIEGSGKERKEKSHELIFSCYHG